MSGFLLAWWSALCAVAVANVVAWTLSARYFLRIRPRIDAGIVRTRDLLLWLSLVYVLGCAFRSVFPMVDVPRICLHDTPVSRIFVGRLVATAAELAFALQWVLLLKEAGAPKAARLVTPLLVAAEGFSWAAVLTQNNLWHAVENSLWTLSAIVAAIGVSTRWTRESQRGRLVILAVIACATGYVAFMLSYDVPMYLNRWLNGIPGGYQYLTPSDGLQQLLARCTVERDWAHWQEDAVWLTLYFTTAVWMSIGLSRVPSLKPLR